MPNPRLAARYAKSLLDLAVEKGQLEQVYADMVWLQDVCKQSRDFARMLRSPIIKSDVKGKILNAVTKAHLSELSNAFNQLLVNKNRESYLPEISTAFIHSYKERKGVKTVQLTTATPATEEIKQSILDQVKKTGGYTSVELQEKVDPSIIGGFVLQIDDKLVDNSVSHNLKEIAKQFANNDFVYKIK